MAVGIEKTRSELRTAFYDDANANSDVVSTAKVDELLQAAGVKLAWFVVRRSAQRVFYKVATVNTVANQASITLPDNCLHVVAMKYTDSHGCRQQIHVGGPEHLDDMDDDDPRDWTNSGVHYVFTGDTVEFDPVPEAVYAIKVHFVPSLPFRNSGGTAIAKMTADTDVVSMPYEFHRYLTLTAVDMWLSRRKEDASAVRRELQDWATLIQDTLGLGRQRGQPRQVRDVLSERSTLDERRAAQIRSS